MENYGEPAIHKLESKGYITISKDDILLTPKGDEEAQKIIRRHRLAERLLTDVLNMTPEDVEKGACEFEHILAPELTESICILLGHPRLCPHGSTIPPGPCCEKRTDSIHSLVMPLTEAELMQEHKISYINTQVPSRVNKLFQFFIVPGSAVYVSQKYPAYIIHNKNQQLAIEEAIAKEIYVWRS